MRKKLCLTVLGQVLCSLASASPLKLIKPADVILINGSIYTMRKPLEKIEAVAVKGQTIIGIGDNDSMIAHRSKSTKIIDLHGKTVLPGFIESHGHLAFMGIVSQRIKIKGLKSELEVADLVRAKVTELKPGEWLISQGWSETDWGQQNFPTYQSITDAAPNNPVLLTRVDGHTAWINKKTMEMAGINSNTEDPDGGVIIKDKNGDPTGILLDKAQELVSTCATSLAGPSRSSRAMSDACKLAGTGRVGNAAAARARSAESSRPASSTALVISSTNSGMPSVRSIMSSRTFAGSALSLTRWSIMASISRCPSRLMVRAVT